MRKRISVTETHIDKGARDHPCDCPIALALIEAGFHCPIVKKSYVAVLDRHANIYLPPCLLPKKAKTFIRRFDNSQPVSPFTFTLDLTETV